MIEMRVRDKYMINLDHLVHAQIANTGSGVYENVIVQ